jgi:CRP-like cAMP-binding protein
VLELRVRVIEQAPLFRGLDRAQCLMAAERARERQVKRKGTLFQEGEPARDVWLLGGGRVKLTQLSRSGHETILRLVGPGEVLGGLGMATLGTLPFSAVALETSLALAWDRPGFEEMVDRFPQLGRNALRIMVERLRNLEERYCELATERVAQRVARGVLRLMGQVGRASGDGVLVSLSREDLAQMTGTTLFTVSRLLSHWESLGFVRAGREEVVIDHPEGLVAVAEEAVRGRGRRGA